MKKIYFIPLLLLSILNLNARGVNAHYGTINIDNVKIQTEYHSFKNISNIEVINANVFYIEAIADNSEKVNTDISITKPEDERVKINIYIKRDTLFIECDIKTGFYSQKGDYNKKCNIKIISPKNTSLKVNTSSGDILIKNYTNIANLGSSSGDIEAYNISANLDITSSSGDQSVKNSSANIRSQSTSGDISVINSNSDNISIKSTSGYILIQEIKANNISLASSSGDMNINKCSADLSIKTSSASVILRFFQGKIDYEASSGDFEAYETIITSNSNFLTSSGNIWIELLKPKTNYSYYLESTSGDIKIDTMKKEDEFRFGKGSISIKADSSSGDISFLHL